MLRMAVAIAVATIVGTAPLVATAGPQYSASKILDHFKSAIECRNGVCQPKPERARKVCYSASGYCKPEEVGKLVTVKTKAPPAFDLLITFELGSAELSRQARENLREFSTALKNPLLKLAVFSIDGHTDGRGTEEFNQTLSERRAASVVAFLVGLGVPKAQLKPKGYGEYLPRVDDPLAAVNRRVEAKVRLRDIGSGRQL